MKTTTAILERPECSARRLRQCPLRAARDLIDCADGGASSRHSIRGCRRRCVSKSGNLLGSAVDRIARKLPTAHVQRRLAPKKRGEQNLAEFGKLLLSRGTGRKEITGKVEKRSGMLL
jgi:hypothetical protein